MARLLTEGADEYATGNTQLVQGPWLAAGNGVQTAYARTGTKAFRLTSNPVNMRVGFVTTDDTLFLHTGWLPEATPGANENQRIRLMEGTISHLELWLDDDRRFNVSVGGGSGFSGAATTGTILARTTKSFPALAWSHVQFGGRIHDTLGSYTLKVNGESLLTASGIDTKNGGTGVCDSLNFSKTFSGGDWNFDDVVLNDSLGTDNNGFEGEVRVFTQLPSADTATKNWTPNSGTANFSRVNEVNPDDDTSTLTAAASGLIDLYEFADLPGSVLGVTHAELSIRAKKSDSGAVTLRGRLSSATGGGGAVTAETADLFPGTTYSFLRGGFARDPKTGLTWTPTGINGLLAGINRTV